MSDPNHPQGLAIRPSSKSKRRQQDGVSNTAPSWQIDTVEDITQFGIAGRIWEAAYLFQAYLSPPRPRVVEFDPPCPIFQSYVDALEDNARQHQPRHIVELGSGVGLVGLACAQQLRSWRAQAPTASIPTDAAAFAASSSSSSSSTTAPPDKRDVVVLTDLDNVVPLLERNARSAGFPVGDGKGQRDSSSSSSSSSSSVDVWVRPLPWGSKTHADEVCAGLLAEHAIDSTTSQDARHPIDYILCSDLVYFPELLPPLLRSLLHLTAPAPRKDAATSASSPPPPVMVAYKIRSMAKEEPFWNALGCWFDVDVVSCRYASTDPTADRQRRGDGGGGGDSTQQPEMGEWHRFGSRLRDVDASVDSDDDPAEDTYFLFFARRKPETLSCLAPDDDAALMAGMMLLAALDEDEDVGGHEGEPCGRRKLVQGRGGAEYLEWALMGDIDF